jgi:hypothetical protein
MENKVTSHIVKGIILSAISIVFSTIVYVFNLYEMQSLNYFNYAIIIAGLIYGAILYSNENNNRVTFGNVFAHGFKTTAVIIAITSIYTILSIKFLFPEIVDISLRISRKGMESNVKIPKDTIEQNLNFVRKYFIPLSLGISMIGLAFLGLIGSLIGAAVAKKNTNPFENTTV